MEDPLPGAQPRSVESLAAQSEGHGLVDGVVYGPARSRRYGTTLGVNLLPAGRKTCSLECVYCQLGHVRGPAGRGGWAPAREVFRAVRSADPGGIDAIVISGNGEPTLHPRFAEAIEAVREGRDLRFPGAPIVCLTAGTELHRAAVRGALRRVEECAVKLDCGRCETLQRIARPGSPACVAWLTTAMRTFGGVVVQACFFDGPVTNADDEEVGAWIDAVRDAEPIRVDVYTVSRPAPSTRIRAVPAARLHEIAARLRRASGLEVRVIA